jgi:cytochrome c oxidase subunit 2
MLRPAFTFFILYFALFIPACTGAQSVVNPAGPQAGRISDLWWFFFSVCSLIFVLVAAGTLYAVGRRRRPVSPAEVPQAEQRYGMVVSGLVTLTVLILFVFLIASVRTGNRLSAFAPDAAVTIDVVGHQWWWEVHYHGDTPSQNVTTANEIHVPVGRPVLLKLTSRDVIHSFWAPNLHGKKDLIPGHETTLRLQADRPGVFRGQCAEFCGHQHAHMAFVIVAEAPEQFNAWLERQRQPAPPPVQELHRKGQTLFVTGSCALCHNIQGTEAFGQTAPDLTHVASRLTLAAGTTPNTQGHLAGWIVDPQAVKPGAKMPATRLTGDELHALVAYLRTLQ